MYPNTPSRSSQGFGHSLKESNPTTPTPNKDSASPVPPSTRATSAHTPTFTPDVSVTHTFSGHDSTVSQGANAHTPIANPAKLSPVGGGVAGARASPSAPENGRGGLASSMPHAHANRTDLSHAGSGAIHNTLSGVQLAPSAGSKHGSSRASSKHAVAASNTTRAQHHNNAHFSQGVAAQARTSAPRQKKRSACPPQPKIVAELVGGRDWYAPGLQEGRLNLFVNGSDGTRYRGTEAATLAERWSSKITTSQPQTKGSGFKDDTDDYDLFGELGLRDEPEDNTPVCQPTTTSKAMLPPGTTKDASLAKDIAMSASQCLVKTGNEQLTPNKLAPTRQSPYLAQNSLGSHMHADRAKFLAAISGQPSKKSDTPPTQPHGREGPRSREGFGEYSKCSSHSGGSGAHRGYFTHSSSSDRRQRERSKSPRRNNDSRQGYHDRFELSSRRNVSSRRILLSETWNALHVDELRDEVNLRGYRLSRSSPDYIQEALVRDDDAYRSALVRYENADIGALRKRAKQLWLPPSISLTTDRSYLLEQVAFHEGLRAVRDFDQEELKNGLYKTTYRRPKWANARRTYPPVVDLESGDRSSNPTITPTINSTTAPFPISKVRDSDGSKKAEATSQLSRKTNAQCSEIQTAGYLRATKASAARVTDTQKNPSVRKASKSQRNATGGTKASSNKAKAPSTPTTKVAAPKRPRRLISGKERAELAAKKAAKSAAATSSNEMSEEIDIDNAMEKILPKPRRSRLLGGDEPEVDPDKPSRKRKSSPLEDEASSTSRKRGSHSVNTNFGSSEDNSAPPKRKRARRSKVESEDDFIVDDHWERKRRPQMPRNSRVSKFVM